jgi:hypothetical protein
MHLPGSGGTVSIFVVGLAITGTVVCVGVGETDIGFSTSKALKILQKS